MGKSVVQGVEDIVNAAKERYPLGVDLGLSRLSADAKFTDLLLRLRDTIESMLPDPVRPLIQIRSVFDDLSSQKFHLADFKNLSKFSQLHLALEFSRKYNSILRSLKFKVPSAYEVDKKRLELTQGSKFSMSLVFIVVIAFLEMLTRYGAVETPGIGFQITQYEQYFRDMIACIDFHGEEHAYIISSCDGAVSGFGTFAHAVVPWLGRATQVRASAVFQGRENIALLAKVCSNGVAYINNVNSNRPGRRTKCPSSNCIFSLIVLKVTS